MDISEQKKMKCECKYFKNEVNFYLIHNTFDYHIFRLAKYTLHTCYTMHHDWN